MVWDLGKYKSPEDRPPEEQLASGKIHERPSVYGLLARLMERFDRSLALA
jgi:hypothetical protein